MVLDPPLDQPDLYVIPVATMPYRASPDISRRDRTAFKHGCTVQSIAQKYTNG